jgi:hypothetical protein
MHLDSSVIALDKVEKQLVDEEMIVDESEKEKDELLSRQQKIQEVCETVNLEAAIEEISARADGGPHSPSAHA